MFSYCDNNPVNKVDYDGHEGVAITTLSAFLSFTFVVLVIYFMANNSTFQNACYQAYYSIYNYISYWYWQYVYVKYKQDQQAKQASKGGSTPANPTPPGNNRKSNKYESGNTYNRDGIRVDYEYNSNGTGNVHVHYQGKKYRVYRLEGGSVDSLPRSLQNNKAVLSAVSKATTFLKQLGGLM